MQLSLTEGRQERQWCSSFETGNCRVDKTTAFEIDLQLTATVPAKCQRTNRLPTARNIKRDRPFQYDDGSENNRSLDRGG